MNLDLADLRAFVAVADLGSFHAAAETLHLSQPALSRRIVKLEDMLGVRLFERTTRRVSLTLVGRELLHKAHFLLDQVEGSLMGIRELTSAWMSEVAIACVPSAVYYFLPAVLLRYRKRFPGIRVRILDDGANDCLARVMRGEVEFGLNFIGTQEADIEFEPILREAFVLVCRRDDPLAERRQLTWSELASQRLITVSKASGNRLLLDLALAELPVKPQWQYEVRHVSMPPALVEAGLGVAAVPQLAMPATEHPQLIAIPLVEPKVTRTLGLMRRRGRSLSPPAEELYALIAAERSVERSGPGFPSLPAE